MSKSVLKQTRALDAQNLESARVILENSLQYGGQDAALVEWARIILDKHQPLLRECAA